jgi:cyclopropane fatty-acyl-phospholipid synthase-like methyltransferase
MREYDLIADWWASERVDTTADGSGVPELVALAASLQPGSRVLDIGCGNGVPLTKALLGAAHRVVGLDSASNMLHQFRANYPETPAVMGMAQACPFAAGIFDAAIAWGVMFHLKQAEQVQAIASVSGVLKMGAPFLFTAGDANDDSGDHVGTMNGVEFHYYSFTTDGYRSVLRDHCFTLVDVHEDHGGNGYYLAHKAG